MSDALITDMLPPGTPASEDAAATPSPAAPQPESSAPGLGAPGLGAPGLGDGPVSGSVVPSETSVTIRFSGDQGIAEAEATRDMLRHAFSLAGTRRVVIDCDELASADLTFIQLLIAARKSGERMGRDVVLSRPARGVLAAVLAAGGLALPAGEGRGWLNPFWAGE